MPETEDEEPLVYARPALRPISIAVAGLIDRREPNTVFAWVIALSTTGQVAIALGTVIKQLFVPPAQILIVAALTAVVTLVLAIFDAGQLRARGFDPAPPSVLGFIPIVYLIVRARMTRGTLQSSRTLWVHVVSLPVSYLFASFWANITIYSAGLNGFTHF